MKSTNPPMTSRPWWLIGTIISAALLFLLDLSIYAAYEVILRTSDDAYADLGLILPALGGLIFIGIVFISHLIASLIAWTRGFYQFTVKRIVAFLFVVFLIFVWMETRSEIIDYLFPVQARADVSVCSQIVRSGGRDACFKQACAKEHPSNALEKDKCILAASIQYNNSGSCYYIDSGKEYCSCYYSFAKAGTLNNDLKAFVDRGGDCSRYSNKEISRATCYAIKEMNEDHCSNLKEKTR